MSEQRSNDKKREQPPTIYLCRASGDGANVRLCRSVDEVRAFYIDMFGPEAIDEAMKHFADRDNWSNGGYSDELYCARFEVWECFERELFPPAEECSADAGGKRPHFTMWAGTGPIGGPVEWPITDDSKPIEYENGYPKRESWLCSSPTSEAQRAVWETLIGPRSASTEWIPASQPPKDDSLVVVRDKDGQLAFDCFENGKWAGLPEDWEGTVEWYPIPPRNRAVVGVSAPNTKGD